jgi:hypothetical protein
MMALARGTAWWSFGRLVADRIFRPAALLPALLAGLLSLVGPVPSAAQSVSASERDALVRLRVSRGGRADEVDALIRRADEASGRGLPAAPLTNKIREGLAKGVEPARIELVVSQMATQLETADRFVGEIGLEDRAGRELAVTLLAESFAAGVAPAEARELHRQAQTSGAPPSAEQLAGAAKALAFIKEARLPAADGAAVLAEALRHKFRSHELLDLGREVKRREADYRAGRSSLRALREAIARGDRPDQLFAAIRTGNIERPAAARPEAPPELTRPVRPEPGPRPEQPVRPEPAERPVGGR